jgi:hypothetical protein
VVRDSEVTAPFSCDKVSACRKPRARHVIDRPDVTLLQHSVAHYSAARAAQQAPPSSYAQLMRSSNGGTELECARLVSLAAGPDDAFVVHLYSIARSASAQHISSHRISASGGATSLVSTTLHTALQTVSFVWSNGDWQTYECASLFSGAKPPKPSETRSLARGKQAKAKGSANQCLVRLGGSAAHSNSIVCGGGFGPHSTDVLICCEAAFGTELWRRPLASAHSSEVVDVCPPAPLPACPPSVRTAPSVPRISETATKRRGSEKRMGRSFLRFAHGNTIAPQRIESMQVE